MPNDPVKYVLLLGSNIEKERYLPLAREALAAQFVIERWSTMFSSRAVGAPGTPDFHNQAVLISGPVDTTELRLALKKIERDLDRVRDHDLNSPRTIDIDVVYRVDPTTECAVEHDTDLELHHYVALPVADVDPTRCVPDGRTIATIAASLGPSPEGFRTV